MRSQAFEVCGRISFPPLYLLRAADEQGNTEEAMTTRNTVSRFPRNVRAILALGVLAQAPTPAASAANWKIDPARTHIAFAIDAVGYPRTEGHFRRFEGRISVDFEHPGKSSGTFHVPSQSVDLGSSSFDDYPRSVAFLDSARFPSIDFVSNSVQKIDDH